MARRNQNKNVILPSNAVTAFGVSASNKGAALVYKSKRRGHSKLSLAYSNTKPEFSESDSPMLMSNSTKSVDVSEIEAAQISHVLDTDVISLSSRGIMGLARLSEASLDLDLDIWEIIRTNLRKSEFGVIVPEFKYNGQFVLYHSKNDISLSMSKDMRSWHGPNHPIVQLRPANFDRTNMVIFSAQVIAQGIIVLYQSRSRKNKKNILSIGVALFDKSDPTKLLWRSQKPIWEISTNKKDMVQAIGSITSSQNIVVYLRSSSSPMFIVSFASPFQSSVIKSDNLKLTRHNANPLIAPEGGGAWEAVGTFNPAVLQDDDKIHIMYRALDHGGMSRVGYASSSDGVNIDERHPEPAYWPRAAFEAGDGEIVYDSWSDEFASGGGWGGVEDPKLTAIDGKIYITYVAHPGYGPPRLAMSTIDQDDFRAHRWDKWSEPRLISEPGVVNKSGIILPEKIDGKYVIFHRVFPDILIHYTDDLESLGRYEWLSSHDSIATRPEAWDSRKLSIGATPIRIDEGWLVIYHAVDDKDDGKYKIGAMILDIKDPSKVIARTNQPILEPEMPYENEWKYGIAYPSGAAIIGDDLHVYYGGGDRHVCVATTPVREFVQNLMQHKAVSLENPHPVD